MGTDTRYFIYPDVQPQEVVEHLCANLGAERERRDFSNSDGWSTHFTTLNYKTEQMRSFPTMVVCNFVDTLGEGRMLHFHWRSDSSTAPAGCALINPKASYSWCASILRAQAFFGGIVDISDSDASDIDIHRPVEKSVFHAQLTQATKGMDKESIEYDNARFYVYQHMQLFMPPLSPLDVLMGNALSAYAKPWLDPALQEAVEGYEEAYKKHLTKWAKEPDALKWIQAAHDVSLDNLALLKERLFPEFDEQIALGGFSSTVQMYLKGPAELAKTWAIELPGEPGPSQPPVKRKKRVA